MDGTRFEGNEGGAYVYGADVLSVGTEFVGNSDFGIKLYHASGSFTDDTFHNNELGVFWRPQWLVSAHDVSFRGVDFGIGATENDGHDVTMSATHYPSGSKTEHFDDYGTSEDVDCNYYTACDRL